MCSILQNEKTRSAWAKAGSLALARIYKAPCKLNSNRRVHENICHDFAYVKNIVETQSPPPMSCVFCTLPAERIVFSNPFGLVIRDAFPISIGHTLIIPRRHVGSFFDIDASERDALFALLEEAKRRLDKEFKPDGYNIGINDGPSAGQTIAHLHIHLIPRYQGDREDSRGGVRWIMPEKADYWSK